MKCELCHERDAEVVLFRRGKEDAKGEEELYVCKKCAEQERAFGTERGIQVTAMEQEEDTPPPTPSAVLPGLDLNTLSKLSPAELFGKLKSTFDAIPESTDATDENGVLKCPGCGNLFGRYHAPDALFPDCDRLAGCPKCYEAFRSSILAAIRDYQGGCTHYLENDEREARRLKTRHALETAVKAAIEAEDYLKAKKLREALRDMAHETDEEPRTQEITPPRDLEKQRTEEDVLETWYIAPKIQFLFARNVKGAVFPAQMNKNARKKLSKQLAQTLVQECDFSYVTEADGTPQGAEAFLGLTPFDAREEGYQLLLATPEFTLCVDGETVQRKCEVWCEVMTMDHLRFSMDCPYQEEDCAELLQCLEKFVASIEKVVPFVKHPQFGYLTANVSWVGTGLRMRTWMRLAGLLYFRELGGLYQAGCFFNVHVEEWDSPPPGDIVKIFSKHSLGKRPVELFREYAKTINKIIEQEKIAKQRLLADLPFALWDILKRVKAVVAASLLMEETEAKDLISDVQLGLSLGVLDVSDFQASNPFLSFTLSDAVFQATHGDRLLPASAFPESVRNDKAQLLAAQRASWMRELLAGFTLSPKFVKYAKEL